MKSQCSIIQAWTTQLIKHIIGILPYSFSLKHTTWIRETADMKTKLVYYTDNMMPLLPEGVWYVTKRLDDCHVCHCTLCMTFYWQFNMWALSVMTQVDVLNFYSHKNASMGRWPEQLLQHLTRPTSISIIDYLVGYQILTMTEGCFLIRNWAVKQFCLGVIYLQ